MSKITWSAVCAIGCFVIGSNLAAQGVTHRAIHDRSAAEVLSELETDGTPGVVAASRVGRHLKRVAGNKVARADSIIAGLKQTALTGSNEDIRMNAVAALMWSGFQRNERGLLLEIFDKTSDPALRTYMIYTAAKLLEKPLVFDLIWQGLAVPAESGAAQSIVARTAADIAAELGNEGIAVLTRAVRDGQIKDPIVNSFAQAHIRVHSK